MTTAEVEKIIRHEISQSKKFQGLDTRDSIIHGVCGLVEETGEVTGLLNREYFKKQVVSDAKWIDEIGDVLWYLVAIIVMRGYTIEEVFTRNTNKLAERYGVGFNERENRIKEK